MRKHYFDYNENTANFFFFFFNIQIVRIFFLSTFSFVSLFLWNMREKGLNVQTIENKVTAIFTQKIINEKQRNTNHFNQNKFAYKCTCIQDWFYRAVKRFSFSSFYWDIKSYVRHIYVWLKFNSLKWRPLFCYIYTRVGCKALYYDFFFKT